jgi:hypothetical protein
VSFSVVGGRLREVGKVADEELDIVGGGSLIPMKMCKHSHLVAETA